MGESAGFTFLYVGGVGKFFGNWPPAASIPDCTSSAAASILRFKSNCNVTCVVPKALVEVICVRPEICANCVSRGVATDEAMVSGLAPGKLAETEMVGKSTCGSGATGSRGKTTRPTRKIPPINSEVAIGLRTNGSEMLMSLLALPRCGGRALRLAAGIDCLLPHAHSRQSLS